MSYLPVPFRTVVALIVLAIGVNVAIPTVSADAAARRCRTDRAKRSHKRLRPTATKNKKSSAKDAGSSATVVSAPGPSGSVPAPGSSGSVPAPGGTSSVTATTPAATGSGATTPAPVGVPGNWTMVFDDEFDGNALNTDVWNDHDGWTGQNFVTDSSKNVTVAGGDLILTLASQSSGAAVESCDFGLAVGEYAEARIDFPGDGSTVNDWPAWWLSGADWPASGENDIAEGGDGNLNVNYHSASGAHNQGPIPGSWAGGFHTYGIYRGASYSSVYWDGRLVKTYPTNDNGQPESLILTIGTSGPRGFGAQGEMIVDYVRAWAPA